MASKSIKQYQWFWGYLFMIPYIIGLAIFVLGPVFSVFYLSFTEYDNMTAPRWVGVNNFIELVSDVEFRQCLINTVYFTLASVPLSLILSLFIAKLLDQKIFGRSVFRTIYFLPVVASMVAVSIVWRALFEGDGLVNDVIRLFLSPLYAPGELNLPEWLFDGRYAMLAIIIMSVWKGLGYNIVIYLAGLQSIPHYLYEAAEIDGAGAWSKFWQVTFPMVSPTTFFLLIISSIGAFQMFEQAYIMSGGVGGPYIESGGEVVSASKTLVYYLYEQAFQFFRMGYASSVAVVLFLLIFLWTVIFLGLQKKWVHYQ